MRGDRAREREKSEGEEKEDGSRVLLQIPDFFPTIFNMLRKR